MKPTRKAVAFKLDTGNVNSFGNFAKEVQQSLSEIWGRDRFDFLVNNAGTSHHAAFDKTTEEELDSLYHVHFKGVFFLIQKLLPLINDGGRIVMISSGLTRIVIPESAPYASMKGAIEVLTRYRSMPVLRRGAFRISSYGCCGRWPRCRCSPPRRSGETYRDCARPEPAALPRTRPLRPAWVRSIAS